MLEYGMLDSLNDVDGVLYLHLDQGIVFDLRKYSLLPQLEDLQQPLKVELTYLLILNLIYPLLKTNTEDDSLHFRFLHQDTTQSILLNMRDGLTHLHEMFLLYVFKNIVY